MEIFLVGVVLFLVILLFAVAQIQNKAQLGSDTRKRVQSKYKVDEIYVSSVDKSIVGINFDEHKIILGCGDYDASYDFVDIASVEVIENGVTLTQTNRGSQLVGAAIGGLAFGALGAVVGGLSGRSISRGRLQRLSLKVTVDNRQSPVYMICFLKSPNNNGLDPDGFQAEPARQKIDRIHAHILNAMRRVQAQVPVAPLTFGADELQKLWDLKLSGILTENEFTQQKTRYLSQLGQPNGPSTGLKASPGCSTYSVVMVDPGPKKIQVIKRIRDIMSHVSLREAKGLVDDAPSVLISGVSSSDADTIKQRFFNTGATIDLKPDTR